MTLEDDAEILKRLTHMFSDNVIYADQVFNINRDGIMHYAVYHNKAASVDYLIGIQKHNRELKNNFGDRPLDILMFRREYLKKKRREAEGNVEKQKEWDGQLKLSNDIEIMLTETAEKRLKRKPAEKKKEKDRQIIQS